MSEVVSYFDYVYVKLKSVIQNIKKLARVTILDVVFPLTMLIGR